MAGKTRKGIKLLTFTQILTYTQTMKSVFRSSTLHFLCAFSILFCADCSTSKETCEILGPKPHAFEKAGPIENGYVLPSGRAVTPAGESIVVGIFPMNMAHVPSKNVLIVLNNGRNQGSDIQTIQVIDLKTRSVVQTIEKPEPFSIFLGIAATSDGSKLYVSGGAQNKIYVFDIGPTGELSENSFIDGPKFPGSIALTRDSKTLVVTEHREDKIAIIDLSSSPPAITHKIAVGKPSGVFPWSRPYWITLSKNDDKIYVSNWTSESVSVFDFRSKQPTALLRVGKAPEGMALSPNGKKLYVANSNSDDVTVIDTEKDEIIETISVKIYEDSPFGASPTAVETTKDGKYILVTSAGTNSVDVFATSDGSLLGQIPVAWYPTALYLDEEDHRLFVVAAKGFGSGPNRNSEAIVGLNKGVISIIDWPKALANLDHHTHQVIFNNNRALTYYDVPCANPNSPVPGEPGGTTPIKHVMLIVKENKTYDAVLGDLKGTEADESLVVFDEVITPNTHKLAREFANFDNCYAESEVSIQGHMWLTASISPDYVEKSWLSSLAGNVFLPSYEPAATPPSDFIFHHLLRHNVKFMIYGQAIGTVLNVFGLFGREPIFSDYVDLSWPGGLVWSTDPKDEDRGKYFAGRIKEWEKNDGMPQFIHMVLPNDHTNGVVPGILTPESMIADNDYGFGLVVEAVAKSKFWKDTAIFVVE
ncbi:MAG: beta-propeller fold lactonase family protein, partial [Pseudomonadota bacterium]